jgi:hypothetical protein
MNKSTKALIMVAILAIFSYYRSCSGKNRKEELSKKGKITVGKILHPYKEKASTATMLLYTFSFSEKAIKDSKQCYNIGFEQGTLFKNKQFPVIFLESDPNINSILIFPSDYKEFNLIFPDSLGWVKKYE